MANTKNKGIVPTIRDPRTKYVPVGCGKCMECKKQKARQWQIRLQEEIRHDHTGKFMTFTFTDKSLRQLEIEINNKQGELIKQLQKETGNTKNIQLFNGYDLDNEIATLAVRRYLERHRKQEGKSQKHWLVTELGQNSTERIHIHGIIWTNLTLDNIRELWQYGNVNSRDKNWKNNYCTEQTVNYIVKYVSKQDKKHKYYNAKILTSSGIGKQYMERQSAQNNKYRGTETKESYTTRTGINLPLPIYYRNKIYNDEQREQLWLNLLDKQKRYVNGIEVDISETEEHYEQLVKDHRLINEQLGYGGGETDKEKLKYEQDRRNIKRFTRNNKKQK